MPGPRSRGGCTECRRRRRKCDELKPTCGQCFTFGRPCVFQLRVVWGAARKTTATGDEEQRVEDADIPPAVDNEPTISLVQTLPNGLPLSPRYQRLLNYFTNDILASLSCHPSVHEDLCRGLVPATLHSPRLLSACLALSAAGFLSRGVSSVDGVDVSRILGHLQSSGLSLLRTALGEGRMDETVLATCLIWCLTDVFTCQQGSTSWRIHLRGIKAILDGSSVRRYFATDAGPPQSAMRHLYLLYLSLQTLPHVPMLSAPDDRDVQPDRSVATEQALGPRIDGFLGYSEELLHILQRVNQLARASNANIRAQADALLGRLNEMIRRDADAPPDVSIPRSLSPEHSREYKTCHATFQQATLVYLYRRLFRLPSNSAAIQASVAAIVGMVGGMAQGQPCHTWVAMSMPLFTIGCEAYDDAQQAFMRERVHQLDVCIGSHHVRTIGAALEDIWQLRRDAGDVEGDLCADELLDALRYNIILF